MNTDRSVLILLAAILGACAASPVAGDADGSIVEAAAPSGDRGLAAAADDGSGAGAGLMERRTGPLTVEQAVDEALQFNRVVKQARLSEAIGDADARVARSALIPRVDATGGYLRLDQAPGVAAAELGTTFRTGSDELWSFDVAMSFPIYGFGRHLNRYRAAVLAAQSSEQGRAGVESDIAAAVNAAAFDMLETMRNIGVAKSTEEALRQTLEDARALEEAGRVTKVAVLEAEVEHDRARRQRERLESLVPILRMTLNSLLGRPAHAPTEIVDRPDMRAPIWQQESLEEEAVLRRPELRAAQLDVDAAAKTVRATVAQELPELRGVLGWETDDSRTRDPEDSVSFLLTLDIPIFTGGARAARIRRARHELEIARLKLRDLETQVRTDVAMSYREVVERFRDIEVADRSRVRQRESLRIQREKFNNGRATSREVLDSTSLLTEAEAGYVTALYDYNIALRELHRARGADPRQSPFFEARGDSATAEEN